MLAPAFLLQRASIRERTKLGDRKKHDDKCQAGGKKDRGQWKKDRQNNEKCQAGMEARDKKQPLRHGSVAMYVGERIGGYLGVRMEGC